LCVVRDSGTAEAAGWAPGLVRRVRQGGFRGRSGGRAVQARRIAAEAAGKFAAFRQGRAGQGVRPSHGACALKGPERPRPAAPNVIGGAIDHVWTRVPRRGAAQHIGGEPACRPGSVATLPVTWEHSPNMPPDLPFRLPWLLIVSGVFSASRGTETELADARRSRGGYEQSQPPPPGCAAATSRTRRAARSWPGAHRRRNRAGCSDTLTRAAVGEDTSEAPGCPGRRARLLR
jgi:hypothetical protein